MFQPEYPDANAEAWDGLALYQGATYDGGCESCGEMADADDVMKLIMRLIGDLDVGDQQRVMDNLAQLVGRSGTKIVGSGELGSAIEMPGADYALSEESNAFVGGGAGVGIDDGHDEEVDFGIAPEALSDSAVMGSAEIVNFVIEEDGDDAAVTGGASKKEAPPPAKPVSLDDFAFITEDEPMPNNDDTGIGDVEDNPYNTAFGEWTESPEALAEVHTAIDDLLGGL